MGALYSLFANKKRFCFSNPVNFLWQLLQVFDLVIDAAQIAHAQ
jgi:hypothetical protein